ncbi:sensor histidine kinase [Ancylobacter oerskovii]|uniref:histidine kinase n=1 Tax=Ancylobacter oerskovii TaxID=459519 RepID=A0ABW4YRX2_9HYPH
MSARLAALLRPGGSLAPVFAALLAAAIFAVDTLTQLDIAIAVLYVAAVMLAADRLTPRGILLAGAICIALTAVSFLAVHGDRYDLQAVMRAVVATVAIGIVTLLSLRHSRSSEMMHGQAALLDLTHDAILVRDAADTILYWNRGAEELYGWPAGEATGRKTTELLRTVFPVSREASNAQLQRDARWEGELRHTRRDGTHVVVASRWSQHRDPQGRPVATMETNNDITAGKQAEERLLKAQAELAQVTRMATLGQLMASIAHEVNQPLAAVVTNGEAGLRWLRRPVPDVAEASASVERMIANGRRAGDVVARLRALSRRDELRHEPVALNPLIEETLAIIERELQHHRARPQLDLAADLPLVRGDRVQLQQVLTNLVINAAQAMDGLAGSRPLVVRSRPGRDEAGEPVVEIAVVDRGAGVAAEAMPRLFEPFHSTKSQGMGLGLSICRSIVETHMGRIEALPNADRGMTFRVILPALKEPTP